MIILDYLAYELSLIILPMWKVLLHASTLGWSGEYLEPEKANDAAASAKPSCCKIREFFQTRRLPQQRSKEEGEYSDELSWVFFKKDKFSNILGNDPPRTQSAGKNLTKTKIEQQWRFPHFNLLDN